MKDRHLDHTQWIGQFRNQNIEKMQGIGSQKYNNNEMVKTSSDQLPQQGFHKQNMTKIPHRF